MIYCNLNLLFCSSITDESCRIEGISKQAKRLEAEKQKLRESLNSTRGNHSNLSAISMVKTDEALTKTEKTALQSSRSLSVCSYSDIENHAVLTNEALRVSLRDRDRQATINKLQSEICELKLVNATILSQAEKDWVDFNIELGRLRSELLQAQLREQSQTNMLESYRSEISELKGALSERSLTNCTQPPSIPCPLADSCKPSNLSALFEHIETEKVDRIRFKQQVMEHGMKMVEEVRQRSAEEHAILLKRIEFLTEELDESASLQARCQDLEQELLRARADSSESENALLRKLERLNDELTDARQHAAAVSTQLRDSERAERDARALCLCAAPAEAAALADLE